MQGINEFIIEIKQAYSETIKTKSGLEIYANKDFSFAELSNRIGRIISVPALAETEIKEGDEVFIDPSILYEQTYRGEKQESVFLVDREKGWYRIEPRIIVLFKKDGEWRGNLNNLLIERIEIPQEEIKPSIIITETPKVKYEKNKAKVKYSNTYLEQQNIKNGDAIYYDDTMGISVWLNEVEYHWIRNEFVLGKAI